MNITLLNMRLRLLSRMSSLNLKYGVRLIRTKATMSAYSGGGGYEVVNSHIEYGQDFFDMEVPTDIDYIISNPPYSKKDEVYKRLFEIGKPFAMLINVQGFCDNRIRSYLFAKYGVQIMYIYPRVNYIKDGVQTKGNAFQSGYICYQMLPKDLMIYIDKGKQQSFDFIE